MDYYVNGGFHPTAPHHADVMPKACGFCKGPRWTLTYFVGGMMVSVIVCEAGCDDAA